MKIDPFVVAGAGAVGILVLTHRRRDARASSPAPDTAPEDVVVVDFGRPVAHDVEAVVSSGWTAPRKGHMHRSIDIPLPIGTPILALDHGIVARVQRQERDIAGIWVGLTHPSGISSLYVHLSRIDVERGQRVERGQVVGLSGDTGNARGKPHLHLNLRASPALLPSIEAAIGRPPFGWGPPRRVFGHAIPAEPFVPVDGHRARVKRAAAIGGIPLYRGPITLRPSRQEESP